MIYVPNHRKNAGLWRNVFLLHTVYSKGLPAGKIGGGKYLGYFFRTIQSKTTVNRVKSRRVKLINALAVYAVTARFAGRLRRAHNMSVYRRDCTHPFSGHPLVFQFDFLENLVSDGYKLLFFIGRKTKKKETRFYIVVRSEKQFSVSTRSERPRCREKNFENPRKTHVVITWSAQTGENPRLRRKKNPRELYSV